MDDETAAVVQDYLQEATNWEIVPGDCAASYVRLQKMHDLGVPEIVIKAEIRILKKKILKMKSLSRGHSLH